MAGAMAGGGGGGGDMSGGFDPSAGAGGAMGAGSNPLMQFLMSGSIGQKMRQAQMQQMQMQQLQQTQRAGAEAGNTLKAWAQGGGQGGPMPAPGGNAAPPQPVAPGVGSPPAAPAGGAPGGAPGPIPQQGPMPQLQRASFGGPAGAGGGGREGQGAGGAQYGGPPGAPPGMPQAPQMQQAPMPPPRPPGLGTSVPPMGRGAPQSPMSLASQNPNATGFPGKSTPLMAQKAPPGAAGILRNAQGPGMGSIGAGPGTRFGPPGGAPPPTSAKGPANAAESRANILKDAAKSAPAGTSYSDASGDLVKAKAAIAKGEGSGSYSQMGPETGHGRAVGKYQVMEANIPSWTKEILGKSMTPAEFRADPQAQEAVVGGKLQQYYKQTGSWRDAASIWHSGVKESTARAQGRHDVNESTGTYVDKFASNFSRGVRGDKVSAAGVSQTPEGKAGLQQAQNGQLDLRTAVKMFIATNPNAKPGDMIPALKELLPFMNEESQAENRKLQEADRQERLKETETYHREQTKDREEREANRETDRKNREEDRATAAEDKKTAAKEKADAKIQEGQAKLDKEQADRIEKLDKDYENQKNQLDTRITGKETSIGNVGVDTDLGKKMQRELQDLKDERTALKDQGKPSERQSAGKGRESGGQGTGAKKLSPEHVKTIKDAIESGQTTKEEAIKQLQEQGYDTSGL